MNEYQILTGTTTHVQQVLNTWRHSYTLHILHVSCHYDARGRCDQMVVLLIRGKSSPDTVLGTGIEPFDISFPEAVTDILAEPSTALVRFKF